MSSNTGSGNQGTAQRGRVQATTQALRTQTGSHGQSGSPGPSTRTGSRPPAQQQAVRAGSHGTHATGTPNAVTVDGRNTRGRLASPAPIVAGQVAATPGAPRNPDIRGSSSRNLGSPAGLVRGQTDIGNRNSPISTASSSPSPSRKSEAGNSLRSEASSSSPGSGIHGKNNSHASDSAGDSPSSFKTADSADSVNNGEGFIRRITGQASNAGSSNPPTDFVLCIDGTGNDMVNEIELKNTNIARITDLIKFGTHEGRMTIVAYQQGLGNEGKSKRNNERSLAGWAAKLNARLNELWPTAGKIATLVAINYAYISMNVCPNKDRIFLFGFSRGAYISQITAALVADLGILSNERYMDKLPHRDHSEIIRDIVGLWAERRGTVSAEKIKSELGQFGECLIPAKIQFLGLFDMVASVGAPDLANVQFQSEAFRFAESMHNRPNILKAYHAVAISEHRNQFKPVLWKQRANNQSMSQVWFPGYHTSIGGGTKTQGMMIYYITLVWMLSKCGELEHVVDKTELTKLIMVDAKTAATRPDKEKPFLMPDSRKGKWTTTGLGDHIRSELGSAPIDMVHRVCDGDKWVMRCAPQMPDIDGTAQHPIQTKNLLQKKLVDKPNKFELDFYDGVIFKYGPGQRSESVSPPKRVSRGMAHVLDS